MYITKFRLVIIGLVVVFICLTYAYAQIQNEGGMLYTPTRAEWLAVKVNSEHRENGILNGYSITVIPDKRLGRQNVIQISCIYLPTLMVDIRMKQAMNESIQLMRQRIMNLSKHYGWHSWVEIEERVEPLKTH